MVTPIPKGNGPPEPNNTRPISILPAITKLIEKVVQRQLVGYLEVNCLLSGSQHGYRSGYSTETALTVVSDHVLRAMDAGEVSVLVLLDLSKCFDVVPHQRLLEKLSLYGVETGWFENYLRGHTQQVQMPSRDGGEYLRSAVQPNTIGVFQEGSLSCTLFSVFSNDMCLYLPENVRVVQSADDTQLLVSGKKCDLPQIIDRIERAVEGLYTWFCANRMKLNGSKTQVLVLGTPALLRGMPPVAINVMGTVIPDSRVVKNLGVIMDTHLNFRAHIDHITAKCTGILIGLIHAKHVIPARALPTIVQALVNSVIRYCMSVYGTCTDTQLHRVQKLLNFGARVISGRRKYDHISDVLKDLRWLDAHNLVRYHRLCLVHSVDTTGRPESIADTLGDAAQHQYMTRAAGNHVLPRIRTEAGRRRLCYSAVQDYDSLPINVNARSFRAQLRKHLLRDQCGQNE